MEMDENSLPNAYGNDRTFLNFLHNHPQRSTHQVCIVAESKASIPNFVGGPLPRRDQGNREDYCMVMLMLFKPWREGKHLKPDGNTWDETFNAHIFTYRQYDIMNFFQIKYECNDARDDYCAQRKAGKATMPMPFGLSDDIQDDLDSVKGMNEIVDENIIPEQEEYAETDVVSKKALRQDLQMRQAEVLMNQAGLTVTDHTSFEVNVEQIEVDRMSAGGWKALLTRQKNSILEKRDEQAAKKGPHATRSGNSFADQVKIIQEHFLSKTYRAENEKEQFLIDNTVRLFTLNKEQERAFRIIANHATQSSEEQLNMYLGGMAGTGKSQVIKALIYFFDQRDESYRFMCMAPTGAAASLIQGSTYHSMLQLGHNQEDTQQNMAKVHNRLKRVEYIFLDEVSMINCRDMYTICSKMCKAIENDGKPFGGINIICSGDFAQLPPAMSGYPLFTHQLDNVLHTTHSHEMQEAAIGKAVWHQITTVVILRQNMRQNTQSHVDANFRTALENMRYKSCTALDINFLRTLVAKIGTRLSLGNPVFRNVSIITCFNSYRDRINELGVERFARESGQELHTFYSVDTLVPERGKTKGKKRGEAIDTIRSSNILSPKLQEILWNLAPGNTEHRPGILKICKGMPVMIKHNEATECGVTNGAEAVVVGWTCKPIGNHKNTLETLFVKLTSPPVPITLDGLPENVFPLSQHAKSIYCVLRDGSTRHVSRMQVPVLPNFAMTDYNSQGRTRSINVVDLQNCKTVQSVYTCLSRSSSALNTMILQGFDPQKIRGGLPGNIRQEFRELELLDEITELKYNQALPGHINAKSRRALIHQYRKWKGDLYVPKDVHSALRWSANDPLVIQEDNEVEFKLVTKDRKSNEGREPNVTKQQQAQKHIVLNQIKDYIPAQGTNALATMNSNPGRRRGIAHKSSDNRSNEEKATLKSISQPVASANRLQGFKWSNTYSCAYDSLWTILLSIYREDPGRWNSNIRNDNIYFVKFSELIDKTDRGIITLEQARDTLRHYFHSLYPDRYPITATREGTDISELCNEMFRQSTPFISQVITCINCNLEFSSNQVDSIDWVCTQGQWSTSPFKEGSLRYSRIQFWLPVFMNPKMTERCTQCRHKLHGVRKFDVFPNFISFGVDMVSVKFDRIINIQDQCYRLCGIVYHGDFHFSSRIISSNGDVWSYDGMLNDGMSSYEEKFEALGTTAFYDLRGRTKAVAIYTKA